MKWSRSRALLTGAALIVATNVVVLGGVAYNRSGEPESTLKLTQRELALPYAWGLTKENSGLELHIAWRVVEQESDRPGIYMASYYGGATPYWLNEAKLIALGIDVSRLRRTADDKPRRELLPSKEVFLALELDGPEYQKLLEQVRTYTAAAQNRLRGSPGDKELEQRAKVATEALKQEERENSRLVVVDAGLERDALRTTYSDRTRYAIVRGRVQPQSGPEPTYTPRGRIVGLSVTDVGVPASLRGTVGDARPLRTQDTENTPPAIQRYGLVRQAAGAVDCRCVETSAKQMTSVIGPNDKITGSLTSTTIELGRALSNRAGVPVMFGRHWATPSLLSKCEWMPR